MTLGLIGGGSAEQLAPSVASTADMARSAQLYDRLFDLGEDLKTLTPRLALSAEPNADATVWTFKLRDGVVWHNGKPFGADDVVYTMRSWQADNSATYGAFDGVIDYKNVRKRDNLTVEVPLAAPFAQFSSMVAGYPSYGITPAGMTLHQLQNNPVGTGPFKYRSFQAGSQSIFTANTEYWESGKPYVDRLVVNSTFSDNNALHNALLSGAVDVVGFYPYLFAKEEENAGRINILHSKGSGVHYFYMDVKKAPFNDVRVRQAMRLLVDRQAMVDGVLAGYGEPANDLWGEGAQYFASDLKRTQDIAQAKSLLKAAGQENLSVTVSTSDALPGAIAAATLLAEQAKAAGVNIKVNTVSASTYFNASSGYPYELGQETQVNIPASLTAWYRTILSYGEARWGTESDKLLTAATRAVDPSTAAQKWHEAQMEQFNTGGYLVWGNIDNVDASSKRVRGLKAGASGPLNNWRLLDGWVVGG